MRSSIAGAALALSCAQPACAAWHEASSAHFVVYADEKPDRLLDYATRLERFDRAMRVIRNIPDRPIGKANRLTVYIIDQAKVTAMAGQGIAGFYSPRAGETLAVAILNERVKRTTYDTRFDTLFHEYAHHFLYGNWPNAAYPMWFSEGYAELAGTAQFTDDGTMLFGVPNPYHLAYIGNLPMQTMTIPSMVASDFKRLSSDALMMTYMRGWLLAHYLQFEPNRRGQLAKYLTATNKGTPAVEAARQAFGDLYALEREVSKYRTRRIFPQLALSPAALKIGLVEVRALDAAEAATMPVRVRVKNSNRQVAGALAGAARRAADDHPNSVAAQTVLAEAEFDAERYAQAEAAADRALAVDPKALEAMLYKGRARMALAVTAKATDADSWADIRRWFIAANRVDPDDPRPLIFFYRSFGAVQATPTANAVTGLNYAFALAPQDQRLRLMVARQYVVDAKVPDAIAVLRPLAFSPHGGELAMFAQNVIADLNNDDAKAALARWNGANENIRQASGIGTNN